MSGSDATSPSTPVFAARCAWAPTVMCYHASHLKGCCFPGTQLLWQLLDTKKTPKLGCWGPGYMSSQVMRRSYRGQAGGKMVLAHCNTPVLL
jgi:hypothetical protein